MQSNRPPRGYADENGEETVDDWNCHPDCAIKMLDEQSGILKSGAMTKPYKYTNAGATKGSPSGHNKYFAPASKGGASRFFYCAKASRSERNKGLEAFVAHNREERGNNQATRICKSCGKTDNGYTDHSSCMGEYEYKQCAPTQNTHPTVKPVKLMQWLVGLITPPGGTVLDPFNGSGTTGIACKLEGFNYIDIEQDQESCDVSTARIAAWEPEPEDFPDPQISLFPND